MTITQSQATERVEGLIRNTAEVLEPQPRLELIPYSVTPNPCAYSADGLPERFTINRAYWLRGLPRDRSTDISRQVRARWEAQGHVITATGRAGNPGLTGTTRPDGYTLALVWAEGDNLYLAATSPCVK